MRRARKLQCRLYQKVLYLFQSFLKYPPQEIVKDEKGVLGLPKYLHSKGFINPIIITGKYFSKHPLMISLKEEFEKEKMGVTFYHEVIPNPTFDEVYKAVALAKASNCDSVIALGGGSSLDVGKLVAALLTNPKARLDKLKGLLKVRKKPKMFVAVPTTAGSGSSGSISAVIINPQNREKFAINDPKLLPTAVLFDDSLLISLSKLAIAGSGMDALTHAIEAYIGHAKRKRSKHDAISATRLVMENILSFYNNTNDEKARNNMLEASYMAGKAFSVSYVGYVHALSHALSGMYNLPHGYTNAILLPHVLRAYGSSVYKPLARLCDAVNLTSYGASEKEKAEAFINRIEELNDLLGIPKDLKGNIEEKDIITLASLADEEANPLYPVPKLMDKEELGEILKKVQ